VLPLSNKREATNAKNVMHVVIKKTKNHFSICNSS
jgi:hypothetical protein